MNLHLVAFPHTRVEPEFSHCAYTMKVLKFARMMGDLHRIYVYAPDGPAIHGAELVPVLRNSERKKLFGKDDPNRLPAWPNDHQWSKFNANAAIEIQARLEPDDLVLLAAGWSQYPIAQALPHYALAIEPGVGYEGTFARFCSFESYAWMHYLYGKKRIGNGNWGDEGGVQDGRWYDVVIPNYFDSYEFPHLNDGRGDHLLFIGRLIARKGLLAAADVSRATGLPLVVAGAGMTSHKDGEYLVSDEVTIRGDIHYVGSVGVEERAELMAGARALLAPTTYIEPFGGVAVEAMMAGTPAITTDWGAFTETVPDRWRFRTLQEAVDAIELLNREDPIWIRDYARQRYSLEAVAPRFEQWFQRLDALRRGGWYELREREAVA